VIAATIRMAGLQKGMAGAQFVLAISDRAREADLWGVIRRSSFVRVADDPPEGGITDGYRKPEARRHRFFQSPWFSRKDWVDKCGKGTEVVLGMKPATCRGAEPRAFRYRR
jgi:hypothetical protein